MSKVVNDLKKKLEKMREEYVLAERSVEAGKMELGALEPIIRDLEVAIRAVESSNGVEEPPENIATDKQLPLEIAVEFRNTRRYG